MKFLGVLILILSFTCLAQEKEADLQMPVTDLSRIEKQKEEIPPTIEEVEMVQKEEKVKTKRPRKKDKKPNE